MLVCTLFSNVYLSFLMGGIVFAGVVAVGIEVVLPAVFHDIGEEIAHTVKRDDLRFDLVFVHDVLIIDKAAVGFHGNSGIFASFAVIDEEAAPEFGVVAGNVFFGENFFEGREDMRVGIEQGAVKVPDKVFDIL